jgi:hypothetical protein
VELMGRRIIGQCNTADFSGLLHIGDLLAKGQEIHLSNLSNRQKMAVRVIDQFQKHDIPLKTLSKIKEVLVWDMGDGRVAFEYKLLNRDDIETHRILRGHH